jgi:hypothetical protein
MYYVCIVQTNSIAPLTMGYNTVPTNISGSSLKLQYDTVISLSTTGNNLIQKKNHIKSTFIKRSASELKKSRCSAYKYLVP